ncbi:MAG: hypothetical protein JWN31_2157 [Frankiales bacterium]|nr:hypothetical protein [Frankiales bacterium]
MTRRGRALLLASVLLASLLAPGAAAVADSPPELLVSEPVVAEPADYASEVLSDPWDFSNSADVAGPTSMDAGLLTYSPSSKVQPSLVNSTASSQAWGRDGRTSPVDASRYTVLSVRLWSSARSPGGVSWTTCGWDKTECRGFYAFRMQPGWNTYDLKLRSSGLASSPAAWSGLVTGLRLTGASGPTVKVDWVRLREPLEPEVFLRWDDASAGDTVYWDLDGDSANNTRDDPSDATSASRGWGVAGQATRTSATARTARVLLGAFPPGSYRFFVPYGSGTERSEMSAWVTVTARPQPVVLTPSSAQGADWATTVGKNPWDMAQASDYSLHNARRLGANGRWFAAENTSNDPSAFFGVGSGFAGSTYHRVQIKMALLGAYSLANAPGGGCVGRLLWTTAKGGLKNWQTTDDLVLYPGWNTIDVDMATSPPSAIVDPALGARRIGWAGQTITQLRFDPNEDPGKRRWYLDDVRVAADPVSTQGRFDITFTDLAGAPGTTAKVEAVDSLGQVTALADAMAVQPGTNTVSWYPTSEVPDDLYRFRLTLTNAAGSVTRWAPVPVHVIPA